MAHICAPDIEFMGDVFGVEYFGESPGGIGSFVSSRSAQDVYVPGFLEEGQEVVVVEVGEVGDGGVEINILVVIAVGIGLQVVNATHGDDPVEEVGSFEVEVGRVEGAERSTANDNRGFGACFTFDKRNDFAVNVLVELLVSDAFVAGVHIFVEPAFGIDAVDGKHFYLSGIYMRGNGINHQEALVFEVVGGGGGQQQQGESIMAIDGNFHLLVEGWAVPMMYFSMHARGGLSL